MITQVILILITATIAAAKRTDSLIIGGEDISIEKVPWQVSLRRLGKHRCGGAIITADIIITAAHCVHGHSWSDLSVRAGSSRSDSGGSLHRVYIVIEHEDYSRYPIKFDIAMMKLSSSIQLGNRAQMVHLRRDLPTPGSIVFASGWGRESTSRATTFLKGVELRLWSREYCIRVHGSAKIRRDSICASAPGKASCFGDSGGPLMYNRYLVGLTSWGRGGCANPKYPGVYTSVPDLFEWVLETGIELIYGWRH